MPKTFDVAIAGASLGGASAAVMLSRLGFRVALLDKAIFPRRKPCGEGLSSFGLKQLKRLGLEDAVLALPHVRYKGYRIGSGLTSACMPSLWGDGVAVQRSLLDAVLFEAAANLKHVEAYTGATVKGIQQGRLLTSEGEISAKHIIVADGSNSKLASKIHCDCLRHGPARNGISATFLGQFKSHPAYIDIIVKRGFEIYCTPVSKERLNVSVLANSDSRTNIRDVLMDPETLKLAFARCGFSGSLELEPMGRVGVGNVRRQSPIQDIHLVGDAKEEFDPIGGMGMAHALRSGIEVAEKIARSHDAATPIPHIRAPYAEPMRRFTTLCYHTLRAAEKFPVLFGLATSSVANHLVKALTKDLA